MQILSLNSAKPCPSYSVDQDQMAAEEENWSGFALFAIKYVNFYQQPGSSNLAEK